MSNVCPEIKNAGYLDHWGVKVDDELYIVGLYLETFSGLENRNKKEHSVSSVNVGNVVDFGVFQKCLNMPGMLGFRKWQT